MPTLLFRNISVIFLLQIPSSISLLRRNRTRKYGLLTSSA